VKDCKEWYLIGRYVAGQRPAYKKAQMKNQENTTKT